MSLGGTFSLPPPTVGLGMHPLRASFWDTRHQTAGDSGEQPGAEIQVQGPRCVLCSSSGRVWVWEQLFPSP